MAGVRVMAASSYFPQAWYQNREVMQLYQSLHEANEAKAQDKDQPKKNAACRYATQLLMQCLRAPMVGG